MHRTTKHAFSALYLARGDGANISVDQEVDKEYEGDEGNEKKEAGVNDLQRKIVLLEPHVLNTFFPAWLNQQPSHNVLHLAGCSSMLRVEAFRHGLRNMCRQQQQQQPAPLQLGLTREFLARLERDQPLEERAQQLVLRMREAFGRSGGHDMDEKGDHGDHDGGGENNKAFSDLSDVQTFQGELRNLFQRGEGATGQSSDEHDRCPALIEGLRLVYAELQRRYRHVQAPSTSGKIPNGQPFSAPAVASMDTARVHLSFLEAISSSGFELAVRLHGWDELALLLDMETYVSALVELTREWIPLKYNKVLYYPFKHGEFLAAVYEELDDDEGAERSLRAGLAAWTEMRRLGFNGYGRGVTYADPTAEGVVLLGRLGTMHCRAQRYTRGLAYLTKALALQDETWGDVDVSLIPVDIRMVLRAVAADATTCAKAARATLAVRAGTDRLNRLDAAVPETYLVRADSHRIDVAIDDSTAAEEL